MERTRLVILEDDRLRVKAFEKKFSTRNVDFVVFDNVDDFKEYVTEHKEEINMFFLDHDLEGLVYVPSEHLNTGYQAALFLKELYGEEYPDTIIHSMNPVGARNIKSVLGRGTLMPFPALITSIV